MSAAIESSLVGGSKIVATGTATMIAGGIVVSYPQATSGMKILLTVSAGGGTRGFLSYSVSAGASFTIASTSGSETSTVVWAVIA